MLYVTTRTDRDAFTSHRAAVCELGPDGGQFLPRIQPHFDKKALEALAARSFNQNVAHVLSLLYRRKITAWDVDLVIGKRPMGIVELNSRTLVAETWRNSDWRFDQFVERLFRVMVTDPAEKPGQWFTMSVRIAVLFGIFGELMARGIAGAESPVDISVPSYDFQFPMAVWYAKSWGLPIGNIICCCNENNAPWTLLHQGQMRTDTPARHTVTAACDQAVPRGLERLIYATLGLEETRRYVVALEERRGYKLEPEQRELVRAGLTVTVVSQRRMEFMIHNIYRTVRWVPDPYAAMAYAGLVDFRSRAGETGTGLIISEENPVFSAELLAKTMGISADALRRRLQKD